MANDLRSRLSIPPDRLEAINSVLLDSETRLINDFLAVVAKYGTPEEINQQADDARQLPALLEKVKAAQIKFNEDCPVTLEVSAMKLSPVEIGTI